MTVFSSVFEMRRSSRRIWIDCSGAKPLDELDRACQFLLEQRLSVAVLDDCSGALISNVSTLENLWLPRAWRDDLSIGRFQDQLSELIEILLPMLPDSLHDLRDLLRLRPGELSADESRLVVLMRAILMKPELVLLSPSWISGLVDSCGQLLLKMMELQLPGVTWLAFDEIEPSVVGMTTGWVRVHRLFLQY